MSKIVFSCYGTIPFECVSYLLDGERKTYKKAGKGKVCSACNTLWEKLIKYKRRPKNEYFIDEKGSRIIRTRKSTFDQPKVTFREGKTINDLNTTKPQYFKSPGTQKN